MFSKNTIILDIVSDFPETEDVFRRYDGVADKCILCHNLFDSIGDISAEYSLNLDSIIGELNSTIDSAKEKGGT